MLPSLPAGRLPVAIAAMLLGIGGLFADAHVGATPPLAGRLAAAAPAADPQVLELAARAVRCAERSGATTAVHHLAVIDYTRPSAVPRLWIFDLADAALVYEEVVAHGRNSGGNFARKFSNEDGSRMSSLGLFRTAATYDGANGYSLRLRGLEPGVNDNAWARAIVLHGAWYVSDEMVERQGRIGRSWGCPAVRPAIARPLIDTIKEGALVFAYYPDRDWLAQSAFLRCDGAPASSTGLATAASVGSQ